MVSAEIKTIIFDLGGVILDLSVDHTLQSFSELSGLDKARVKELFQKSPGFEAYEKGLIGDEEFRDVVRTTFSVQATDAQLDESWNAMLRSIPQKKLDLLLRLKNEFTVFLLSNTNNIHLSYVNGSMLPVGEKSLDRYFHRSYYSHLMKMRKPDAEIFEQVVKDNNLNPAHTLFLDDNADNVAGAKSVGIQTVHVTSPDLILEFFHA
jgi:putative hydrolase of the HAD superfamily